MRIVKAAIFKEPQPKENVDFDPMWEKLYTIWERLDSFSENERYWIKNLTHEWQATSVIAQKQRRHIDRIRYNLLILVSRGLVQTRKQTFSGRRKGEPCIVREFKLND